MKYFLYIGTQTDAPHAGPQSEGIYRASLDERGQLGDLELMVRVENPSWLALGAGGRHLYATCEIEGSAVGAWAQGEDGAWHALNYQPSGGAGACHLSLDAGEKNLLVANYGGGTVATFPIGEDGSLGAARAVVQHEGSGPNTARQEKPHAHSIYCDESGGWVYACDLGTDEIKIYDFDAARGTLAPAEPPAARVAPGGGPRHLALHARGFAYVNLEMGLGVTTLARDLGSGALTPGQTVSTLPENAPTAGVSTSGIALHPGGNYLYVSNRGHESIAVFGIGAEGDLTLIEHVAVPAEPRGFALSPDGRFLVVGGQKAHQLAAFAIDPASGKLTSSGPNLEISAPLCIVFAP